MTTVLDPPTLTLDERRTIVRRSAQRTHRRRALTSRAYLAAIGVSLLLAFIPLAGILWTVVGRGLRYMSWTFLTTPQQEPSGVFHATQIGGISNFIVGTVESVGLAVLMAVPVGVLVAVALYESTGRVMRGLRMVLEVMVGMPSILFGVFITLTAFKIVGFSVMAGSLALAFLMVPLIAVAGEDALRAVPSLLTEAALALGARRSKVMLRVVFPTARPRVLTGVLLALARAVGETAPVFYVMGSALSPNWNPLSEASSLTTGMFNLSGSDYASQRNEVWGLALVLVFGMLVVNVTSRIIVARANKGSQ